ncbi:hypothetical protein PR048_031767 [Dryococelus australis]|uniref:Uncharacterized protein n=1 Tax=Dryococelus australis TaxID=614101 RepID=A0ABQ9G945_9NEOP|nr:hypothetical protein PR048_031767 [Dryococelus australis]
MKDLKLKECNKRNFDRGHGAKELRQLTRGERVWIRNMKRYGKIHAYAPFPRSYIVQTWQGQVQRNRVHLIRAPEGSRLDRSFHEAPETLQPHHLMNHHPLLDPQ